MDTETEEQVREVMKYLSRMVEAYNSGGQPVVADDFQEALEMVMEILGDD